MAEPQIDVAGAQAALDAAGGMPDVIAPPGDPWSAPRNADGTFAAQNTPADAPTPDTGETPPAADGDNSSDSDEIDFGSFTDLDVNALTPEMQQMQRSLQADYT